MNKPRVIVYVDGFNFYYGLKAKGWKKFYWLDFVRFFEAMVGEDMELVEVHYFSARPLDDKKALDNQTDLFAANKVNPRFKLTLGKYLKKELTCGKCGRKYMSYEEKETDVRIATQMIDDVRTNRCDVTAIVSADSDLIPALQLVKNMNPAHRLCVYFPPLRHSENLKNIANDVRKLDYFKARFRQSLLAGQVTLPNGHILKRPVNWV